MSIQFRSRIKTVPNYQNDLSDKGVCCIPPSDEFPDGRKIPSTWDNCIIENGYFHYVDCNIFLPGCVESVTCPSLSSRGCCCACKYVDDFDGVGGYLDELENYTGGLKDGVTLCECSSIGGHWYGPDSTCELDPGGTFSLCTGQTQNLDNDVRFPQGCCVNNADETFTCQNVCSELECSELQPPDLTGTIWPENACNDPIHDHAECNVAMNSTIGDQGGFAVPNEKHANLLTVVGVNEQKVLKKYRESSSQSRCR